MATFQIVLQNGNTEVVDGVDGYDQDGAMITFFTRGSSRHVLDSWSTRVASFRSTDLKTVRRLALDTAEPTQVHNDDAYIAAR